MKIVSDKMAKSYKRKGETREVIPDLILIFSEGTRTEPNYFKSFKLNTVALLTIGTGRNTISLIRFIDRTVDNIIRRYAKDNSINVGDMDYRVWCVFDKDDFEDDNFNNSIRMAESRGYYVAYSNEAFELWYVLHFDYLNTGVSRKQYCSILSDKLEHRYEKSSEDMYKYLISRQNIAIKHSQNLLTTYPDNCSPVTMNPATTVHELVMYLNKFR